MRIDGSSAIVELVQEEGDYGTGDANSLNDKRREAEDKCECAKSIIKLQLNYKNCGLKG